MKTHYDSFVLCKSNRNTYIIPHNVVKSRYTNVKYHCEISWYFSVHCLPQSLRNYKEEAKIKPSEKALAMPGQSFNVSLCSHRSQHRYKMIAFDIICYEDYDSVVKYKLSFNFSNIKCGRQMWSRAIFETESETETRIP